MKRLIYQFTLGLVAVSLLISMACCDAAPKAQQPTEKQVWLPSSYINHAEQTKGTYHYNEYGNEIRTESYTLSGVLKGAWIYEYDEKQNLIKRSVDTGDGTPFVQLINTYDENGRLIKEQQFMIGSEATYTYRYDKQGKVAVKLSGDRAISIYTHYEDGSYRKESATNPEEYTLYNQDGKVAEIQYFAQSKYVYVYDKDGKLTECVYYRNGEVSSTTVYEQDENGNNTKIYKVDPSGERTLLEEYTYELYTVKVLPES